MIKKILLKEYINNASDILSLLNSANLSNLIDNINKYEKITVHSHLIHKSNIAYLEQVIFNLDMYISFLKSSLNISDQEIRCIVDLTLNDSLLNKIYYYDNKKLYIKLFKSMIMKKYLFNYNILKKYINVKKMNYDELILKLNLIKNKAHFYFEDINKNLPYYIEIINYLENTSSILV